MDPTQKPQKDGRKWQRAFPGSQNQIRQARRFTTAHIPDHPDAALIVSELATNAVEHTRTGRPGGTFTLTICRRPDGAALIEVEDQGGPEAFGRPTHGREGGRGLTLVEALATAWGVKGDPTGRTVWACPRRRHERPRPRPARATQAVPALGVPVQPVHSPLVRPTRQRDHPGRQHPRAACRLHPTHPVPADTRPKATATARRIHATTADHPTDRPKAARSPHGLPPTRQGVPRPVRPAADRRRCHQPTRSTRPPTPPHQRNRGTPQRPPAH